MARYQQSVGLQQVGIAQPTLGGENIGLTLSDRLEQFRVRTGNIAGEQAIERGKERASEENLSPGSTGFIEKPKYKPTMFGGIENKAYHNALSNRIDKENDLIGASMKKQKTALLAAYIADVDNSNREEIAKLEIEHSDNIVAFNKSVLAYRKGALNSVDPLVKMDAQQDIDARITESRIRILKTTHKKILAQSKAKLMTNSEAAADAAAVAARNGDQVTSAHELINAKKSLLALEEAGFLKDGETAASEFRKVEMEVSEQSFRREFDILADVSMEEVYKRRDELGKKVPKGWEADEWGKFLNSALKEAKTNNDIKEIIKAEKQQKVKDAIALSISEAENSGNFNIWADTISNIPEEGNGELINKYWDDYRAAVKTEKKEKQSAADRVEIKAAKTKALEDKKLSAEQKENVNEWSATLEGLAGKGKFNEMEIFINGIEDKKVYGKFIAAEMKELKALKLAALEEFTLEEYKLRDRILTKPESITKDEIMNTGKTVKKREKLSEKWADSMKKGETQKVIESNLNDAFKAIFEDISTGTRLTNILPGGKPFKGISDEEQILFAKNKARAYDRINDFFKDKPDATREEAENFYRDIIKPDIADTIIKAVMFKPSAPVGAIEYLKENPETKGDFLKTFGYLPEGIK